MTLPELIAKLEQASGPSRELDAEIEASTMFLSKGCTATAVQLLEPRSRHADDITLRDNWCVIVQRPAELGSWHYYKPAHYTASLDAALTLAPKGAGWNVQGNTSVFFAAVRGQSGGPSKTPALALCIAVLRAQDKQPC